MSSTPTVETITNSTILVVDDNPVNRRLLESIIRKAGYQVVTAVDGKEAMTMVKQAPVDLILLDIIMPEMDGLSVCKCLQNDRQTSTIPVIMVSSLDLSETKIQCFELGAVDYITKPFHQGEILARIRSQLSIKQLTASLVQRNTQLKERQDIIDQDLMAAAAIQQALLPASIPFPDRLHVEYIFQPCERIGGDIFNVFALDDHSVGIYIVDVCGHGVPAAMIATLVSQAMVQSGNVVCSLTVEDRCASINDPIEVLTHLDRLFPIERFDRYFTITYMTLDLRNGSYVYGSAGHPPILLQKANGKSLFLDSGGPVIGLGEFAPPREIDSGQLTRGDKLFFYTDGIVELENPAGDTFGLEGIQQAVTTHAKGALRDCASALSSHLKDFTQHTAINDDISVLCLEYTG